MPDTKRILYTRFDGGVSICQPASEIIRAMGGGGFWTAENGFHLTRGFIERQIESKIERGVIPDAARRLCQALAFGGAPTSYAWEIIRDSDCGHLGVAHDLVGLEALPKDRTYRNAWRRSRNGGPVWIDEYEAQKIDEARMWAAYEKSAVNDLSAPRFLRQTVASAR
jgi:hypothetical protein